MTTNKTRAAFSLMELMIAIMILGIGMVMVATVFPVGLDMSRTNIQMSLSQAIAETAVATLQLKVPAYTDIDKRLQTPEEVNNNIPPLLPYSTVVSAATRRVLVPDVASTDLDANLEKFDLEVVTKLNLIPAGQDPSYPVSYPAWGPSWETRSPYSQGWQLSPLPTWTPPQPWQEFVCRTRVFTERTGWSGELNLWERAWAVPAQNIPANWMELLAAKHPDSSLYKTRIITTMMSPAFANGPVAIRANFPRIHLADEVYPPVTMSYDPNFSDNQEILKLIQQLASRRYCWSAIHRRISPEQIGDGQLVNPGMYATVVVTHRGDLNERYARQAEPDVPIDPRPTLYDIDFDLSDPDYRAELLQPGPDDDATTDMLFPRPWLVMLNQIDPFTGEIGCSGEVARLLPADSFFIVAETDNTQTFHAGTPHRVRSSTWTSDNMGSNYDFTNDTTWARLEIDRGTGPIVTDLLVWVFPPAIQRAGSNYQFTNRTPIVGVAQRLVEAAQ